MNISYVLLIFLISCFSCINYAGQCCTKKSTTKIDVAPTQEARSLSEENFTLLHKIRVSLEGAELSKDFTEDTKMELLKDVNQAIENKDKFKENPENQEARILYNKFMEEKFNSISKIYISLQSIKTTEEKFRSL